MISLLGTMVMALMMTRITDSAYLYQDCNDHVGKEFVVMFLNNIRSGTPLQLSFTTPLPNKVVRVRIYTPIWNSAESVDVMTNAEYGKKTVVNLPESLRVEVFTKDTKTVLISAEDSIVVFASNIQRNTGDAFLVYPIETLGVDYVALNYKADSDSDPAVIGCVATSESTEVNITLPAGTSAEFDSQIYTTSDAIRIELHIHELFQIKSLELTGAIIQSNHNIACFGGTTFVKVRSTDGSADHIVEQLKPVNTWSNYFVVVSNPIYKSSTAGEFIRIVSFYNNTNIAITVNNSSNLNQSVSLNRGQFYEFFLELGTTALIFSNETISVGQFSTSKGIDGTYGDQRMVLSPAIDEYLSEYTFVLPGENLSEVYTTGIVLYCENKTKGSIKLDGFDLSSTWFPIGMSGYYYTYLITNKGFHNLTSDSGKFGGYLFGYGATEEYGTSFGRDMRNRDQKQAVMAKLKTATPGTIKKFSFVRRTKHFLPSVAPMITSYSRSLQECLNNCLIYENCEIVAFRKGMSNTCLIFSSESKCSTLVSSDGFNLYKKQ